MERADLVRLERTDDGVQQAPVVEQDEVPLLPIVRVHELCAARRTSAGYRRPGACTTYVWRDGRALHLVEQRADLRQILEVGAVWVQGAVAFRACWERRDDEFLDATRVHLEVEVPRDRVLPQLRERAFSGRALGRGPRTGSTHHGERLDLGLVPFGEVGRGELETVALDA